MHVQKNISLPCSPVRGRPWSSPLCSSLHFGWAQVCGEGQDAQFCAEDRPQDHWAGYFCRSCWDLAQRQAFQALVWGWGGTCLVRVLGHWEDCWISVWGGSQPPTRFRFVWRLDFLSSRQRKAWGRISTFSKNTTEPVLRSECPAGMCHVLLVAKRAELTSDSCYMTGGMLSVCWTDNNWDPNNSGVPPNKCFSIPTWSVVRLQ